MAIMIFHTKNGLTYIAYIEEHTNIKYFFYLIVTVKYMQDKLTYRIFITITFICTL